MFDEEFYDYDDQVEAIARCEECGCLIYDNSSDMYMDADGNYFCCLDCALSYYDIYQPDECLTTLEG